MGISMKPYPNPYSSAPVVASKCKIQTRFNLGTFIKPSEKDPNYRSRIDRRPVAEEPEISDSLKKGLLVEDENPNPNPNPNLVEKPVVCARCHSLRHYGKVKDPTVENLLPEFDFEHTVGRRLVSTSGTRSVVLMVVDASDFDGSFPKRVAKMVSATIDENYTAWKMGKSGNVPRVVLVVTKIDLLPSSLSPTRFEHWVRQRAREGGANKLTSVHLVSSVRDWGLKNLIDDIVQLAGRRGNVWAIGAQNAGKSTLINSIGKHAGGKLTHLTEAPVPGTTLGIVRVEGVLTGAAKLFDTPGLLNPHQITTRLTGEEQKLVHVSKELKPRTYRIKGKMITFANLCFYRIIRNAAELMGGDQIFYKKAVQGPLHYLAVTGRSFSSYSWACKAGCRRTVSRHSLYHSMGISLSSTAHGEDRNACTMVEDHFGRQLQPPIGERRVKELGKWERKEFRVSGTSWDSSSVDVAVAGLGWFAVGLKGEAVLGVWTYDGVDLILRNSLLPHRSQNFEVAGFTVSKIVSKADQASNKSGQSQKRRKSSDPRAAAHSLPSPLTANAG
ncbi:GTP-binding protein brassinazole insensitive pale green 2, chloroplastic [Vitis vinifera]|uniref:GTP-binding protein brassinazole insensitive pale green 2, chloroplastic n=1 Tax=Vitis vinifera TaxID=29760 RepID=A0A438ELN6_VITVI|nr:GTP-binding protein brassinazole insensitive pale green 2, chloroplastic [Vitis vinifera]